MLRLRNVAIVLRTLGSKKMIGAKSGIIQREIAPKYNNRCAQVECSACKTCNFFARNSAEWCKYVDDCV